LSSRFQRRAFFENFGLALALPIAWIYFNWNDSSMWTRISLFFVLVSLVSCSGLKERPGTGCSDYEPSCEFLGATKACAINSNGCQSCTCMPNPGTKLYEQQQRRP
jgi:hypothetical protein